MASHKKTSLGVEWSLPGKKRSFATSTQATNDLIVLLAYEDRNRTVEDVCSMINYDQEAQEILQHFIKHGYGQTALSSLVQ